jgi:hypothetical protein
MRGGDESTTSKQSIFKIRNCHRESNARGYEAVTPNGPAIWGGCVTRRKHRPRPVNFSQKTVTEQGGYGALFAIKVQIL